jgi:thiamine pyrophosphokinase
MPAEGMQSYHRNRPSSNPEEDFILRAVIFANGSYNISSTLRKEIDEDDLIIAADGGAHHCLELGIIPDILIGDMDSVQPQVINDLQSQGTQLIVHPRDKNQTDLELALSFAADQGAQDVLLLGLVGGRLDLSLANLMLLAKDDWRNMSLIVSDGPDTAYIMHDHDSISLVGKPGDIVSLIPLTDQVLDVSTRGLRWPLLNATLAIGNTTSVSNEILEDSAQIKIGTGKLFLVHRTITAIVEKD